MTLPPELGWHVLKNLLRRNTPLEFNSHLLRSIKQHGVEPCEVLLAEAFTPISRFELETAILRTCKQLYIEGSEVS
jgi:hypothetical protein